MPSIHSMTVKHEDLNTRSVLTALALLLLVIGEEVVQGVFGGLSILLLLLHTHTHSTHTHTQSCTNTKC